ncbi:MAG: TOBE domain-containing protein, partial [Xanthobacteraceae bacterium]
VAAKIDAAPGTTVWIGVRPEKLIVSQERQSALENAVAATLVDLAYLGDLSILRLRTADGVALQATIANAARAGQRAFGWNDTVWLAFPPEAAIVLRQ